jgi:hypothetical protein
MSFIHRMCIKLWIKLMGWSSSNSPSDSVPKSNAVDTVSVNNGTDGPINKGMGQCGGE